MEREANYVAVGAFVLAMLVIAVLFVYWYSDSHEHRDYERYEIYFDGTVSGLTEGGAVRYLGVDVGRVQRIRIDPRAANRVQVVADIDATTPVSDLTLAQLELQGVTGVLYIDLEQQRDDDSRRVLAAVPSERYPVIRSAHSDLDQFLSSLPSLTGRLNDLMDRAGVPAEETDAENKDGDSKDIQKSDGVAEDESSRSVDYRRRQSDKLALSAVH